MFKWQNDNEGCSEINSSYLFLEKEYNSTAR